MLRYFNSTKKNIVKLLKFIQKLIQSYSRFTLRIEGLSLLAQGKTHVKSGNYRDALISLDRSIDLASDLQRQTELSARQWKERSMRRESIFIECLL
jgi:hypothetical protein